MTIKVLSTKTDGLRDTRYGADKYELFEKIEDAQNYFSNIKNDNS